jgi:hypothetical protein
VTYGTLTFTVAREIPSLNATMWRHRRAYTKERDHWLILLRAQLRPITRTTYPVRAVIHSLRGRLLDYGNLVGGAKPIPDALVRLGYLYDDAPRWFTCDYFQTKVEKAARCTRISLTPVPA